MKNKIFILIIIFLVVAALFIVFVPKLDKQEINQEELAYTHGSQIDIKSSLSERVYIERTWKPRIFYETRLGEFVRAEFEKQRLNISLVYKPRNSWFTELYDKRQMGEQFDPVDTVEIKMRLDLYDNLRESDLHNLADDVLDRVKSYKLTCVVRYLPVQPRKKQGKRVPDIHPGYEINDNFVLNVDLTVEDVRTKKTIMHEHWDSTMDIDPNNPPELRYVMRDLFRFMEEYRMILTPLTAEERET